MEQAGIGLMSLGTVGVFWAVIMEIRLREPIYLWFMKLFPWSIGLGGLLFGLS